MGTVLQTRLHRALERIPAGMRLRLVIGIYSEKSDIALTDKSVMKERMLVHAERLLALGCRVEFGTHDEPTLERFLTEVAPGHESQCEIQMLLGMPRRPFARRHGRHGGSLPSLHTVCHELG